MLARSFRLLAVKRVFRPSSILSHNGMDAVWQTFRESVGETWDWYDDAALMLANEPFAARVGRPDPSRIASQSPTSVDSGSPARHGRQWRMRNSSGLGGF